MLGIVAVGVENIPNILGIVAVGVVRESRKFRAPMYMAHRAVIFATAHLSCILYRFINIVNIINIYNIYRILLYIYTVVKRSARHAQIQERFCLGDADFQAFLTKGVATGVYGYICPKISPSKLFMG